ncbi:MAG TPA: VOC family protein [Myxococcota bacterium]|nr:VOC family protein [Myxococcota bacterium]
MAGRFFWYELMTTDLEKSAEFFASLLDGDVLRPDDGSPTLFIAPKGTESILFALIPIEAAPTIRSHWIGYLAVDDLDVALDVVREHSGELHALADDNPERDPNEPRFAIVTDPTGAVVNIHQDVPMANSEDLPEVGRVAWLELLTNDRPRAAAFYRELVGWEIGAPHDRTDEGVAHALFLNDRILGLLRDQPRGSPLAPHWTFFIRVPDLDEAITRVKALGGFVFEDPSQVDGGRRVIVLDPTGAPTGLWAAL